MNTLQSGSRGGQGGAGGAFCQFRVGSGQRGASTRHLRYIANPQAVRSEREGVWLQGFPILLADAPYPVLVGHLLDWSHWLEQEESLRHRGRGEVRTHYQAILSFEQAVSIPQARQMLGHWMQATFPRAQAAAFVHTNTRHLHIHVWIAARQTDGRKINLSARVFRQLDEKWNSVYCRTLHRDEREHLLKKGETERWKQLRREGGDEGRPRPERVGHTFQASEFNERERQRLEGGEYDRDEKGAGKDQYPSARDHPAIEAGEPDTAFSQRGTAAEAPRIQQALEDAEQTVSEAARLHQEAQELAHRVPQRGLERDPERER